MFSFSRIKDKLPSCIWENLFLIWSDPTKWSHHMCLILMLSMCSSTLPFVLRREIEFLGASGSKLMHLWESSYSLIVGDFLALLIHWFRMDFVASNPAYSHGTGGCEMKLILTCYNLLNLLVRIASLWNHLHYQPLVTTPRKGLTYSWVVYGLHLLPCYL